MKIWKYIIIFCLLCVSCKTTKLATNSGVLSNKTSAKTVVKEHLSANFDKMSVVSKMGVDFKSADKDLSFSVQMKLKKDEVIYLKGTKIITIFKMKITPDRVQFYSPYTRQYFDGDFSMIHKLLGVEVGFKELQNIILGQAMLGVEDKQQISITEKSYVLSPKNQFNDFDIYYLINPNHFKLDEQYVVNGYGKLDVKYPKYFTQDNTLFPEQIGIKVVGKKTTSIDIDFRSVTFNSNFKIPFKIPNGYKKINL